MAGRQLPATKSIEEISALSPEQVMTDLQVVQRAKGVIETKREQLVAQIREASDELTRLTMQEQLLSLVLRMHRDAANGIPGAEQVLAAQAAAAPLARERNVSANVLSVVRQAQGMAVRPSYVQDRLTDVGIEASDTVVRTALRRWVKRGELERVGPGYRDADPASE